jgi:uncharacterized SAM-binding protein YcdF (DUF218 family)
MDADPAARWHGLQETRRSCNRVHADSPDAMEFLGISKLFWFLAAPTHLLVWMLAAGVVFRRHGLCQALAAIAALSFLLLLFLPIGNWALSTLEDQYRRGPWPAHVDGVLELGGGINPAVLTVRGVPGAETGESRMVASFELARHYPSARIVFSGGNPDRGVPEAAVAQHVFGQLGLNDGQVLYEDRSRDTWENLVLSRILAKPKPGEVWLLVTSAYHMPRAMAVARRLDWAMQPWPSDYATVPGGGVESFGANLVHLDLAAHEWAGLIAYRLADRAR